MSLLIGVAVAVPDPWGGELEAWRADLGDPQAGAIPAHITVLPPTRVDEDALDDVEQHLAVAASSVPAFEVRLRGTATFRPVSPVVFVALSAGISGCEALEAAVRRGPLARELDHPYHPHVTVAHDVAPAALDYVHEGLSEFVARFGVASFTMFQRGTDGSWLPRRVFPLGL